VRRLAAIAAALLTWALGIPAAAHEVRPAYLEIREVAPGDYDILWKTPARGEMRLALDVVLPADCVSLVQPNTHLADGAVVARWRERCPGGLVGREIGVARLDRTLTDALVRLELLDREPMTFRLTADAPAVTTPERQGAGAVFASYFAIGVEHILLGLDHLMFVFALLMLVADRWRLVAAVTAFTAAHSLTLAATTLGWVGLPPAPVEAMIALSIAFVAAEILRAREGRPGVMQAFPWVASFTFGLLHGFGFAGALREIGLPPDAAPLALLAFNVGVEAGQLMFIAAALALGALWSRLRPAWAAPAWKLPVYGVGVAAAFWFVERSAAALFLV
jgi:hydrogenase/urease accessory protein HupE